MKFVLKTKLGDLEFDGVFTNGSGAHDDTLEKLVQLAEARTGFITTKTITLLPRAGNPGPRFYIVGNNTINSIGIPNTGYKEMKNTLEELKKCIKKPICISIGGFSPDETEEIIKTLSDSGEIIELNLSCPNIKDKAPIIYNPEMSEEIIRAAKKNTNKKIAVKAAPFLDFHAQEEFCEIAKRTGVDIINATNTIGNAMFIDPDREKIMLKPKWGGVGGEALKMVAVGNIRRYYEYLKGAIPLIGCGGILSGKDAFTFALAGASAFASASIILKEGIGAFGRMENELEEELKKHNYSSLQEAVGKAKEF